MHAMVDNAVYYAVFLVTKMNSYLLTFNIGILLHQWNEVCPFQIIYIMVFASLLPAVKPAKV